MKPSRRRRALSPEDAALWRHVTRDVAPIKGRPALAAGDAPQASTELAEAEKPPRLAKSAYLAKPAPIAKPAPPPLAAIEPRLKRALRRGRVEVEATLDLHGLTQEAAFHRLERFLHDAQRDGMKLVAVITGKGGGARAADETRAFAAHPSAPERGVLRRLVPLWLAAPHLRALVIGFGEAGPGQGGVGALHVRVRRRLGA